MKSAVAILTIGMALQLAAPALGVTTEVSETLSGKMSEAAALAREGKNSEAEAEYRRLLNDVQLEKAFGHRDAGAILQALAPVLRKLNKTAEAADAESLAKSINDGLVPLSSNGQVYMRGDKSIAVLKRIVPDADNIGFAYAELQPTHDAYQPTLDSVGGLSPGYGKLLPPSIESLDEAMGVVQKKNKQLAVLQNFLYRYKQGGERKQVMLENKKIGATIAFEAAAVLDSDGYISSRPEFLAQYKKEAEQLPIKDRMSLAFFLNGPNSAREVYPWLTTTRLPDMNGEEMQLLAKSFAGLQKWLEAEMEKDKAKREAENKSTSTK